MDKRYSTKTKFLILHFVLFYCMSLLSHSPAWAGSADSDSDIETLQKASRAFTHIAKKALPAVVFIKVEKYLDTGQPIQPFPFNNPFDLFGDDFFYRFFGNRFPPLEGPEEFNVVGMGSGFIISKKGYILTNYNVVGNADEISVQLKDGKEFIAELIGADPASDVALIKIKENQNLPVLSLGNSDALEIGEWVMAIGNPFGLSYTMTSGIVSAKGRNTFGITDYEDFIQIDAAINSGNSGGPLINMKGEAVGINSSIFSNSGGYVGIGFSIPINMVKAIKEQLIQFGEVRRGYLGVAVQDLSPELLKTFGLRNIEGVLVSEVFEDSPAEKGGIKRGDVVVEFHGKKVMNTNQFRNWVALTSPETKVKIVFFRDKIRKELTVQLESLEAFPVTSVTQNETMKQLGFAVQNLTKDLAKQLKYAGQEGVLISDVIQGSPAYYAGMRSGMLILEVNRKRIKNTKEFLEVLMGSKDSERVLLLCHDGQNTNYKVIEMPQSDSRVK